MRRVAGNDAPSAEKIPPKIRERSLNVTENKQQRYEALHYVTETKSDRDFSIMFMKINWITNGHGAKTRLTEL